MKSKPDENNDRFIRSQPMFFCCPAPLLMIAVSCMISVMERVSVLNTHVVTH